MPTGVIMKITGGNENFYNQVMHELGGNANLPKQLQFHMMGELGGGLTIIDLWNSQEDFENFYNNELGEALDNLEAPPVEIQYFQVSNVVNRGQQTQAAS